MRGVDISRKTKETDIKLSLSIDGSGKFEAPEDLGFLGHMLDLFACHGKFDISLDFKGDTYVDFHHSTEDIGIVLGQAFSKALGDRRGITRYGSFIMPMYEALMLVAIDISGRSFVNFDVTIPDNQIGNFDSQLVEEFFIAFARTLGATVHFKLLCGKNSHHIVEAAFKGFAHALKTAVFIDGDEIPSSKGVID